MLSFGKFINLELIEYFKNKELLSIGKLRACYNNDANPKWYVPDNACDCLVDLRNHFGTPVNINHKNGIHDFKRRGICTYNENKDASRNADTTQHSTCAFDISLYDQDIYLVYLWIKKNAKLYGVGAIGLYDTFIHIDFRNSDVLIEWNKRTKK